MSTDVQDLSLRVQEEAIRAYAETNGLKMVATYRDEGRSGLSLKHRDGMKQLLRDVQEIDCPYSLVLVYDVSRWGRFQDADASAYYEYHCRLHDVDVIYVAEPFAAERSPLTSLVKSLKRVMAAEYSRELGVKVRAGHSRVLELGYQMGELPSFGLRRMAVHKESGNARLLGPKDRKGIQSERIKWVPGPATEVELVQRVFQLYGTTDITVRGLERLLQREGTRLADGRAITHRMIRTVLGCEAFVGNFVWRRREQGSLKKRAAGPELRAQAVIAPMIDDRAWELAKAKLARHPAPIFRSRERLLADLKPALAIRPGLGCLELPSFGCASHGVYVRAFGSFREALRLAGADPVTTRDARRALASRSHRLARACTKDSVDLLCSEGFACQLMPLPWQGFAVNGLQIRVQSIWRRRRRGENLWWLSRSVQWVQDYLMLARFQEDETAMDFLLLDRSAFDAFPRWCGDEPPPKVVRIQSARKLVEELRLLLLLRSTRG